MDYNKLGKKKIPKSEEEKKKPNTQCTTNTPNLSLHQ